MVEVIPVILALTASTATAIVTNKRNRPLPPPPEEDAVAKAQEQQGAIQSSRENFIQRQGTLGPIQLQAPTLKI